MGKFDGRVAIITGGGKGGGIGYGLSTAFAKEGCNLVITGRNTKKLDDAKEELERLYGVKVLACQADGGVEEQVAAFQEQCAQQFGPGATLNPANLIDAGRFEVKTADATISVPPERSYLVETRSIDGCVCAR